MWFLRRWRRIVVVLAAYDVLLLVAIFLLEMHYVVDVLAGVLVAALAIAISGGPLRRTPGQGADRSEIMG
jgi:membrane-associated phospholipid phosphatase